MDVNKPVTNPDLLAAIDTVRSNDSIDTMTVFLYELKKAHFLSPATIMPKPIPDENGKSFLNEGTKIEFFGIENTKGESFLLAFTDWSELRKWRNIQDEQTIISTYDDLVAMVKNGSTQAGFVINPYGCNLCLTRDLIENFSNQQNSGKSYIVENEMEVKFGIPENYPHEMAGAISGYLKTKKNVKRAFLVLMEKEGEFSFLVVVDFTGDKKEIFDGIASYAVPLLKKGEFLDMVSLEEDLGKEVAKGHQPFYKRKIFGLF
ncbi:enhanced serine sensitivity protein SseB [Fusobacterium sp. PH5-44]|uniref:enhanced serine sensitivity protein SseB n=1 Tax=unclassified Fusobacterium TaxID=2648384 RepID=UPI003D1D09D6